MKKRRKKHYEFNWVYETTIDGPQHSIRLWNSGLEIAKVITDKDDGVINYYKINEVFVPTKVKYQFEHFINKDDLELKYFSYSHLYKDITLYITLTRTKARDSLSILN